MERINRSIQSINQSFNRMEKLMDSFILEVGSLLMKSQNSPAVLLVLESNKFDIPCREENVIIIDNNKRSNIVNVIRGIKRIFVVFNSYSWFLLSSIIMTTVDFIVNLAFEIHTFNIDILLCRRVYDPGGVYFCLEIYYHTIMLNSTITLIR